MRRLTGALCLAWCAGCTGEVDVWLVDRSTPADGEPSVEEADFPLELVEARREDGWAELARGPDPYNLLDLSGTATPVDLATLRDQGVRVAHDEVPLGAITALRLRLSPGEPFEVEDEHGVDHEVDLSTAAGLLEVPVSVEVVADEPAVVTLSIDVRAALTSGVGGGYAFTPTIAVE